MMRYYFPVAKEYMRVKKAGGLSEFPRPRTGLPVQVIFTNKLPQVERERRLLARSVIVFVGTCVCGVLFALIVGSNY